MGKWIILLLIAVVVLAIIGFLIDVARVLAGIALVALVILVAFNYLRKRSS